MKKKVGILTFAGLALAAGTWLKIAEDVPIHGDIIAPPFKPTCKNGERLTWDASAKRWVCVPRL